MKNKHVTPTNTVTCAEFAGIQALVQIREALGDPCGKLMQDELVSKVMNLIQGEKELREGVIGYIEDHEDLSVEELRFLLDYTQWWDWDFTPPNVTDHQQGGTAGATCCASGSDTPWTDANEDDGWNPCAWCVDSELVRTLERERNTLAAGAGCVARLVRLTPTMRKALDMVSVVPRTAKEIGCRDTTLRALVDRGVIKQIVPSHEPWRPAHSRAKYFLPNA